jgi:ligand-binding sensor domain-containing protein/two-component sensor histidine kinase
MPKQWFILSLLFLSAFYTKAQHPYYYSLNEENGWPSNETYRLAQDSAGYIWIGCSAGLYRYNGISYKAYTNSTMNSKAISGLRFDRKGQLWCYNFTGQIFCVKNNSLHLFKDYSKVCKSYPRFTFDQSGNIWITADYLIEVYNPNGQLIHVFNKKTDSRNQPIMWLETECDRQGNVFIHSATSKLWVWKSGKLKLISNSESEKSINNRGIFRFINNELFLIIEINPARKYQLWKMDPGGVSLSRELKLTHPNDLIYSITSVPANGVFTLSSTGVIRMNNAYELIGHKPIFPEEKISDMLIDREGSYWFSSLQNGVMVIPSIDLNIYNNSNSLLKDDNISTLKKSGTNEIILGTYKGDLFRLNSITGKINPYLKSSSPVYRHVRKIKQYRGNTYIARGAFNIDEKNKERLFRLWNARDFDFMNDSVYLALSDQVVSTSIYNTSENPASTTIRLKGGSAIICDTFQRCVYFACNDGVFRYKNGKLTEIRYHNKSVYASSLQIHRQQLWIGTISDGILLYNLNSQQIEKNLTDKDVLCSNNIRGLYKKEDDMWVIMEKCLLRINSSTRQLYSLAEGLLPKQINAIEITGDTLWIAANNGLIKMPVNMAWANTVRPSVRIVQLMVNEQKQSDIDSLSLAWNQNNLLISFEGVALRSRGNFMYQYRLIPNDTGHTLTESGNTTVRYNSLAPGNYTFEVVCINEDGVASMPAYLHFTINQPYWQLWWFYLLVAATACTIVYLIFNWRIGFLKRRAEIQNQLILSQLTALKAQMNPHFMYNTLNSIQDLIVQHDIKSTNYYLSQFGSLMRKVLDASGSEQILLTEEVEILTLYLNLEKLRFGEQFTFEIRVDEQLDLEMMRIPSIVIQPFVENAIKHGLLHKNGEKKLSIHFSMNNNSLVCKILDNGVGRTKAAEIKARARISHRSFATEATQKRLELLNNTRKNKIHLNITDLEDNGKPTGTCVVIEIPRETIYT